jgi:beta-galactosidase
MYIKDNWRAFRTWEVSATSPWEFEHFWRLRDGVDRSRQEFKTDWHNLQRPGFSPDYEEQRYERMDLAYKLTDWIPTEAAKELMANNGPVLSYIAGKPGSFSSKDHTFRQGEKVQKQLVIINNSRVTVSGACEWSFEGPAGAGGADHFSIPTGQQKRIPIEFALGSPPAGRYAIVAMFKFSNGDIQTDKFTIDIAAKPAALAHPIKIAVFDPKGETAKLLADMDLRTDRIEADAELSSYDLLIIGKAALSVNGPAPDIRRVKEGLKVLMFEQTSDALEKRLGFRVEEYGLRRVYPRVPDHPALAGLTVSELSDWRGDSTLLPPRLKYTDRPRYGPTVEWCGLTVPHLWRCGNRGNVASVLIEKPVLGDFLPLLDGGFSLQYSPLLEYHEGKGMVLFCQMDVTGRTETEPAADILAHHLLGYVFQWKPSRERRAMYTGNDDGKRHLESTGLPLDAYDREKLSDGEVLIAAPGSRNVLGPDSARLAQWLARGGKLIAIGMEQDELNSFLPEKIETKSAEHISGFFEPFGLGSFGAGIGPADLHNRAPDQFALVKGGAEIVGDGILAQAQHGSVVLCQMPPWHFDDNQPNTKRTHRRATFMLSRLLANLGVAGPTPLLERMYAPPAGSPTEERWLSGYYLDKPEEWDDPYRHFRW